MRPPLKRWEREIALSEARRLVLLARAAARSQVPLGRLQEALEPPVRRLTLAQRRQVARALRESLRAAPPLISASGEPSGSAASRRR